MNDVPESVSEILEVAEVCPDTAYTIRVILMRVDSLFYLQVDPKESIDGEDSGFVPGSPRKFEDEKIARAEFKNTVDQIASLDSLE